MQIDKRSRAELKLYFVRNAIPTESNFAEFIDAMLNQREDGITKPPNDALSVEAAGDDASQKKAINLYNSFSDANPTWVLSLNPRSDPANAATAKTGFSIGNAAGISRLFIDRNTGSVGLGTIAPRAGLHIDRGAMNNPALMLSSSGAGWGSGLQFENTAAGNAKTFGIYAGGSALHFADVNASADRMLITKDGDVGIGTSAPAARLSIIAPNATQMAGTVRSAALLVSAGTLGIPAGSELALASFGFQSQNSSHLGIRAYRNAAGGDWQTTSIGLCMDVDNTVRAGASLFLSSNGGIGIGTTTPATSLHVIGAGQFSGNAGVLNLEGSNHAYIQWYPMGVASGRKGWIGYGGAGTNILSITSDAGPLYLAGAGGVSVRSALEVTSNLSFDSVLSSPGRMHITGGELCYMLHKNGVIIGKEWGGTGDLNVEGTKNFRIDHPLDSKRYLVHSVVEGPEAAVFYRGEASLADGECEIELPPYFEALTRKENRTVLVTPKLAGNGELSALAASDIRKGRFVVRAIDERNPAQPFFWEVKAVRADVDPLEVEPLKSNFPQPLQAPPPPPTHPGSQPTR